MAIEEPPDPALVVRDEAHHTSGAAMHNLKEAMKDAGRLIMPSGVKAKPQTKTLEQIRGITMHSVFLDDTQPYVDEMTNALGIPAEMLFGDQDPHQTLARYDEEEKKLQKRLELIRVQRAKVEDRIDGRHFKRELQGEWGEPNDLRGQVSEHNQRYVTRKLELLKIDIKDAFNNCFTLSQRHALDTRRLDLMLDDAFGEVLYKLINAGVASPVPQSPHRSPSASMFPAMHRYANRDYEFTKKAAKAFVGIDFGFDEGTTVALFAQVGRDGALQVTDLYRNEVPEHRRGLKPGLMPMSITIPGYPGVRLKAISTVHDEISYTYEVPANLTQEESRDFHHRVTTEVNKHVTRSMAKNVNFHSYDYGRPFKIGAVPPRVDLKIDDAPMHHYESSPTGRMVCKRPACPGCRIENAARNNGYPPLHFVDYSDRIGGKPTEETMAVAKKLKAVFRETYPMMFSQIEEMRVVEEASKAGLPIGELGKVYGFHEDYARGDIEMTEKLELGGPGLKLEVISDFAPDLPTVKAIRPGELRQPYPVIDQTLPGMKPVEFDQSPRTSGWDKALIEMGHRPKTAAELRETLSGQALFDALLKLQTP
jgi:hypothetical protein